MNKSPVLWDSSYSRIATKVRKVQINSLQRGIGSLLRAESILKNHDDVIKWKHFPRYWPFVRGIHRWTVNSPHKGQWRGALMFSLICAWINGWLNNSEAGDLRRHGPHYDVTVMIATIQRRARVYTFCLSNTYSIFFYKIWQVMWVSISRIPVSGQHTLSRRNFAVTGSA